MSLFQNGDEGEKPEIEGLQTKGWLFAKILR